MRSDGKNQQLRKLKEQEAHSKKSLEFIVGDQA